MGWVGGEGLRDRPPGDVLVYLGSTQTNVNVAVGTNVQYPPALFNIVELDRGGWTTNLATGKLTVPAGFAGWVRLDGNVLFTPGAGVVFAKAAWVRVNPLTVFSGISARYSGTPGGTVSLNLPPLFVDVVPGDQLGLRLDCLTGSLNPVDFLGGALQLTALDR